MIIILMVLTALLPATNTGTQTRYSYTIVDTGQNRCFDNMKETPYPNAGTGSAFYGQDAQYQSNPPAYKNNGDGTITDLNTGLMWQKTPDFVKRTMTESQAYAEGLTLAGYTDWRLPTIKELFSIADFRGNVWTRTPYIDTKYFDFQYPDTSKGWRIIDAQYRSSTRYIGITMTGKKGIFGFNFADGRIKSYPDGTRGAGRQFVRCVRGGSTHKKYGENEFVDKQDGTILDKATGLTWMKGDSGQPMTWKQALAYAEKLTYAGHSDWRLPNVKELQSIVDYTRAPDAKTKSRRSAAIDPVFKVTETESWYWTGTTHQETGGAYYVCFGQGLSAWLWQGKKMNAHGAGAVRSDPKTGDPQLYANGKGPQGDQVRIFNYVRCVRGGDVKQVTTGPKVVQTTFRQGPPNRQSNMLQRGRQGQRGQQGQRMQQGNQKYQDPFQRNSGKIDGDAHQKRFIQRLDKDKDGKVSLKEFDGPKHHFLILDADRDGFISQKEAPKHPPLRRRK